MAQQQYQHVRDILVHQGIELIVTHKKVKNINFRMRCGELKVSVPIKASEKQVADAIHQRLSWILNTHKKLLAKQAQTNDVLIPDESAHPSPNQSSNDWLSNYRQKNNPNQLRPLVLWGKTHQDIQLNHTQTLSVYRTKLTEVMPMLFDKWQPIVGQTAKEQRIKKMKTRWGSCNTQAKRIWLSVYLPAYCIECTEYVIVHELCHLHHPNHSSLFWAEVSKAMPDYQRWHNQLAGLASV